MRRKRREAGIARFENLVQRHPDLLVGSSADQMESGALRERDVEVRVRRPQVDGNRLEHEAEPTLAVEAVLPARRWGNRRGRDESGQRLPDETGKWSDRPKHI